MVIDTLAVVAIALNEPYARGAAANDRGPPLRLMSAASLLALTMVIEIRLGEAGAAELDLWLHRDDVEIAPVDVEQAYVARRPGGKSAREGILLGLNCGDCDTGRSHRTSSPGLQAPTGSTFPRHINLNSSDIGDRSKQLHWPIGKW
jgi:ribonuclease VapC